MAPPTTRGSVLALGAPLGSGRPFSSFGGGLNLYPQVPFIQIGLHWPRPRLAERIAARVHRMVASGLVGEVEGLLAAPTGLSPTAGQALGYKEIIDHLHGRCSLDEAVDTIIRRTLSLIHI